MANPMVGIYVTLVKAGKRTLDSVPETLRAEVKKALEAAESND